MLVVGRVAIERSGDLWINFDGRANRIWLKCGVTYTERTLR